MAPLFFPVWRDPHRCTKKPFYISFLVSLFKKSGTSGAWTLLHQSPFERSFFAPQMFVLSNLRSCKGKDVSMIWASLGSDREGGINTGRMSIHAPVYVQMSPFISSHDPFVQKPTFKYIFNDTKTNKPNEIHGCVSIMTAEKAFFGYKS